jgi:hypothetical protein
MSIKKDTKLKVLFKNLQQGKIITIPLLERLDISDNLRMYYLDSGWLESLGSGAYKKPGDKVEWRGALNAIQFQLETKVHLGGLSALSFHGFSHYFRFNKEILYLFSPQRTKLPKWFTDYNWNVSIFHKPTSFLPENVGIKKLEMSQIELRVSTPERAILECLYLAPDKMDLIETYKIFEGLVNLKPKLISDLLRSCNSVKVKRLFLYMADKANHQWVQFLDINKINLGSGKRMISKEGNYNAKYEISIPNELAEL